MKEPEPKPLFAPDPPDGAPLRRPVPTRPHQPDGYWPWDTSQPGAGGTNGTGTGALQPVPDEVPGRIFMRLAWIIAFSALVLLLTVGAYHLGQGGSTRGPVEDPSAGDPTVQPATPTGPIDQLEATDFDPQGDPPEEYPEQAPLAVDGDPTTAWGTQTYQQQLGPGGLKNGVGLVVDTGSKVAVRQVQVSVLGGETAAQVYVTDDEPTSVDDLEPAGATAGTDVLTFTFDQPVEGRYVTIWLTRLPQGGGGFRGQVAEVKVFG